MRSYLVWFQVQYLNTGEGEITFQSITLWLRIENGSKKMTKLTVDDDQSYTATLFM